MADCFDVFQPQEDLFLEDQVLDQSCGKGKSFCSFFFILSVFIVINRRFISDKQEVNLALSLLCRKPCEAKKVKSR